MLSDGARLRLAPESEARVYRDRLVLSEGRATLAPSTPFAVDALGFRIRPGSPDASLDVAFRGRSRLEVAAVRGDALITAPSGVLLARVPAGSALSLEPQQAGAAAATEISGTLRLNNGIYSVQDTATNGTFALAGNGLDKFVGKCVTVKGTPTQQIGNQPALTVLNVVECAKPPAGITTRSKVLIAGAAAGATAATIGIAGGNKDKKPKPSRDK